jgi:transposase InsO family protein
MIYPLVEEMAAREPGCLRVPVSVSSRVLGFSKQAYYKWRANPVSAREAEEERLVAQIIAIHADDPALGYRLICDELKDQGFLLSERRCWRLCSAHKVFSTTLKKYRCKVPAGTPVEDDLVGRDFTAPVPDVVWLTDITEHPSSEGKLYVCAIKDVFSNRIVGLSTGPRMKTDLAVAALVDAWNRRGQPRGVIIHSDRGCQGGFNWSSQQFVVGLIVGVYRVFRRGFASRVVCGAGC